MQTTPEIKLENTYYIYEDRAYQYREDIEDECAEDYAGLDDDMTGWLEDLDIEEISGLELLKRIGDDGLCLMW